MTMGNSYTYRQNSSGRVQPTESRYLLQPGTCLLCSRVGKSMDEVFANLGVELEYYGIAYLCLECCAEVADFIGFVSPERFEIQANDLIKTIHELDETRAQLERASRLLHGRVDSAISGESDGDGTSSVPLSEAKSGSTSLYQTLNAVKSESSKSGPK